MVSSGSPVWLVSPVPPSGLPGEDACARSAWGCGVCEAGSEDAEQVVGG